VSQFEIVTLMLSLIVGLSMAQMLGASALVIRVRRRGRPHWIPLVWAAATFLLHIQFWVALS